MKDENARLRHSRCALLWATHNGHTKPCFALLMVSYEVWSLLGMASSSRGREADEQMRVWGLGEVVSRKVRRSLAAKTVDDAEAVAVGHS